MMNATRTSGRGISWVCLPNFSDEEALSFFDDPNEEVKKYVLLCCGHPRSVNFLSELWEKDKNVFLKRDYEAYIELFYR